MLLSRMGSGSAIEIDSERDRKIRTRREVKCAEKLT